MKPLIDKPTYMPSIFWSIYLDMDQRDKLNEAEKRFFLSEDLSNVWIKAGNYINTLEQNSNFENAASYFVGCFFSPLGLYNRPGKLNNPSQKTNIRNNQIEADQLIEKALSLTNELIEVFEELDNLTAHYPEELHLLSLIESMCIEDVTLPNDASQSWKIPTSHALTRLTHALVEYPKMKDLFNEFPGLINQKSSWVDWLKQAHQNICNLKKYYPGELELNVDDWAKIYCALINPNVDPKTARDNYVKSAFKNISSK